MTKTSNHLMNLKRAVSYAAVAWLVVITITGLPTTTVAGDNDLAERSKAVATDAKDVVVEAGQSVADGAENLWSQLESEGLTHRTRDEVVAWMMMGALVGGLAGMLTSMRATGLGRLGRLCLGLTGAILGGFAVRLADLDLGWGPVLIRYEELLFSFAGAVLLILLGRLLHAKTQKRRA